MLLLNDKLLVWSQPRDDDARFHNLMFGRRPQASSQEGRYLKHWLDRRTKPGPSLLPVWDVTL
jgi:hypothetical protein